MKKNNYDDINFDMFVAEDNDNITESEKSTLKANFYESVGLEEFKVKRSPTIRKFSRKFVTIAAAMVMVLAFGAVAYATEFFGLGTIGDETNPHEMIAVDDSNQYKAGIEVYDYYKLVLSNKEKYKQSWYYFGNTAHLNEEDESNLYFEHVEPIKEVKKIIEKYNLNYEKESYIVGSAKAAFKGASINNTLGEFWNIDELVVKPVKGYINDDYIYSDKGSVTIKYSNSWSQTPVTWKLRIINKNTYINPQEYFIYEDEKRYEQFDEWYFITEDNYEAKAISYIMGSSVLADDNKEEERIYKIHKVFIPANNHTVVLEYEHRIDNIDGEFTKDDFEAEIDKMDLSNL